MDLAFAFYSFGQFNSEVTTCPVRSNVMHKLVSGKQKYSRNIFKIYKNKKRLQ